MTFINTIWFEMYRQARRVRVWISETSESNQSSEFIDQPWSSFSFAFNSIVVVVTVLKRFNRERSVGFGEQKLCRNWNHVTEVIIRLLSSFLVDFRTVKFRCALRLDLLMRSCFRNEFPVRIGSQKTSNAFDSDAGGYGRPPRRK
jgi:hypothetical protein